MSLFDPMNPWFGGNRNIARTIGCILNMAGLTTVKDRYVLEEVNDDKGDLFWNCLQKAFEAKVDVVICEDDVLLRIMQNGNGWSGANNRRHGNGWLRYV